jgi:copper homeostasis protein
MTLLEIAVSNLEAALKAAAAGADRIELCDNLAEGGTTPAYGYLRVAREKISIPVFPIIRARGGDFVYTKDEENMMMQDVILCRELGFEGVVLGFLTADGNIDQPVLKRFTEAAWPMSVTFHRAFDRCTDREAALETLIECGCERILTSGGQPTAPAAASEIRILVEKAASRIIIMPGSGVRAANLAALVAATGAVEYHSSAKIKQTSAMQYQNPAMGKNDGDYHGVDTEEIKNMKQILSRKQTTV